MTVVKNYFPDFCDFPNGDEKTECNTVSDVFKSRPIQHNSHEQLYLYGNSLEEYLEDRHKCKYLDDYSGVMFVNVMDKFYGRISFKTDTEKEFLDLVKALNVKFRKW